MLISAQTDKARADPIDSNNTTYASRYRKAGQLYGSGEKGDHHVISDRLTRPHQPSSETYSSPTGNQFKSSTTSSRAQEADLTAMLNRYTSKYFSDINQPQQQSVYESTSRRTTSSGREYYSSAAHHIYTRHSPISKSPSSTSVELPIRTQVYCNVHHTPATSTTTTTSSLYKNNIPKSPQSSSVATGLTALQSSPRLGGSGGSTISTTCIKIINQAPSPSSYPKYTTYTASDKYYEHDKIY